MPRGIIGWGTYVPHHRLEREAVGAALGTAAGRGTRAVAGYDEDTTTMAVEAGRAALAGGDEATLPTALVLSTTAPAYVDKTNATTVQAALGLPTDVLAYDAAGAVRAGVATLRTALEGPGRTLAVASDLRGGRPGSADERLGGDAAAAFLCGEAPEVAAELLGAGTASAEFLDRWRLPGEAASQVWEERFGEQAYRALEADAWDAALKAAGVAEEAVTRVAVAGAHPRAVAAVARRRAADGRTVADDLAGTVGHTGAAHAGLLLAGVLEEAAPGEVVAVVALGDGADVLVLRTTDAVAARRPARAVAAQVAGPSAAVPYARFLSWRGQLVLEPPRRPDPDRPAAPPSLRSREWKLGFTGSRCRSCARLHLPPQRVCLECRAVDEMDAVPVAGARGRVANVTVDNLAFTPSPPMVAGLVDLEGGGRFQGELTDLRPDEVAVGTEVELTFRRLYTAGGVHNYFWKARPVRGAT